MLRRLVRLADHSLRWALMMGAGVYLPCAVAAALVPRKMNALLSHGQGAGAGRCFVRQR